MEIQPDANYTMINRQNGEPRFVFAEASPETIRSTAYRLHPEAHEFWIIRDDAGNFFELDMTPIRPAPFETVDVDAPDA